MFNTAFKEQLAQIKLPETKDQEIERLKRENEKLKEELRQIMENQDASKKGNKPKDN